MLNTAYREMAAHYSAAVLPARIKAPQDKPSVENTVGHVATWVIAALRKHNFTTLAQLRQAVYEQVTAYNREPFQKRVGSRASIFAAEERDLLRPLPAAAYEISDWVYGRRVGRNSHITWAKNYYSVPYTHIGETVDVRITQTMVEIYLHHQRIASHLRLPATAVNAYVTNQADLPPGPGISSGIRIGSEPGLGALARACKRWWIESLLRSRLLNKDSIPHWRCCGWPNDIRINVLKQRVRSRSTVAFPHRAMPTYDRFWSPGKTKPGNWSHRKPSIMLPGMFAELTTTQENPNDETRC